MTVIVAARAADGSVAVAADSESTVDFMRLRSSGKLHRVGPAIMGGYGNALVIQGFVDAARAEVPPEGRPSGALVDWLRRVARTWAASMRADGHGTTEGGGWYLETALIIAVPGAIWRIDGNGGCHQVMEPYTCGGSGGLVAVGSLHSFYALNADGVSLEDATKAACRAVRAACTHAPGCGGSAVVQVTPPLRETPEALRAH